MSENEIEKKHRTINSFVEKDINQNKSLSKNFVILNIEICSYNV